MREGKRLHANKRPETHFLNVPPSFSFHFRAFVAIFYNDRLFAIYAGLIRNDISSEYSAYRLQSTSLFSIYAFLTLNGQKNYHNLTLPCSVIRLNNVFMELTKKKYFVGFLFKNLQISFFFPTDFYSYSDGLLLFLIHNSISRCYGLLLPDDFLSDWKINQKKKVSSHARACLGEILWKDLKVLFNRLSLSFGRKALDELFQPSASPSS